MQDNGGEYVTISSPRLGWTNNEPPMEYRGRPVSRRLSDLEDGESRQGDVAAEDPPAGISRSGCRRGWRSRSGRHPSESGTPPVAPFKPGMGGQEQSEGGRGLVSAHQGSREPASDFLGRRPCPWRQASLYGRPNPLLAPDANRRLRAAKAPQVRPLTSLDPWPSLRWAMQLRPVASSADAMVQEAEATRVRPVVSVLLRALGDFSLHPQGRPCGRPPAALRPGNDTAATGEPTSPSAPSQQQRPGRGSKDGGNCGQPQPRLEATSDVSACRLTEASPSKAKPAQSGKGEVRARTDKPGVPAHPGRLEEPPIRHLTKWPRPSHGVSA